jgi:hypothetical protein
MELEVTWNRAFRVWLSYLWRNILAIIAATLVGMLFGFGIGFIMGAMGFSVLAIQFVTVPVGLIAGLAISVVPLKMILGMDFGEFRLVLLAKHSHSSSPARFETPQLVG